MDIYGLIGKNLSHSFSPEYFRKKFQKLGINADYRLFELNDAEEFPELIANNPDIKGLNVTIPYKKSLGLFMDFIDKPVNITGAINTIKVVRNNNETLLSAYNTDVIAFEKCIRPILKKKKISKALIIGTGGSANSVAYVLRRLGIMFTYVTRNPSKLGHTHYSWVDNEKISENLLIINTSPLGMYPDNEGFPPIPYEYITNKHILFDLVYNPAETNFLKKGKEYGASCFNGLAMLEIQANASFKIWKK